MVMETEGTDGKGEWIKFGLRNVYGKRENNNGPKSNLNLCSISFALVF